MLLDALPFGVIYIDRTVTIRYVNRAASRTLARLQDLLQVPAGQIVGHPVDAWTLAKIGPLPLTRTGPLQQHDGEHGAVGRPMQKTRAP